MDINKAVKYLIGLEEIKPNTQLRYDFESKQCYVGDSICIPSVAIAVAAVVENYKESHNFSKFVTAAEKEAVLDLDKFVGFLKENVLEGLKVGYTYEQEDIVGLMYNAAGCLHVSDLVFIHVNNEELLYKQFIIDDDDNPCDVYYIVKAGRDGKLEYLVDEVVVL